MYGRESNKMVKKVSTIFKSYSAYVFIKGILFFFYVVVMLNSCRLQENSDKSVIELQQYAKKNKPNLHILNKLREEMMKLAQERV